MKILDCTIRDGGFCNNWQFDDNCVKASYFAALKSGVDYFEIGYKSHNIVKGRGKYAFCEDSFVSSLFKYSDQCKLVFMMDANKYDKNMSIPKCQPDKTPIKGIRIATYPNDIELAIDLVEKFFNDGYEVFLNLMIFSEWQSEQFKILDKWKNKHYLQAIYFVDSFGSFMPDDVVPFVKKLKEIGFNNIGFHGHNSLQMAFANTLKAIEKGVTYLDATIYGMGRGSGNLPIEILLSYLQKQGDSKYNVVSYLDVIERFYLKLYQEYTWGYSLKSLLGGIRNIHPYYIDELFKAQNYTVEEIWNALNSIKEKCPSSFSDGKLKEVLQERFYIPASPEQAGELVKQIEDQIKIFPSDDTFSLNELKIKDRHKDKKFLVIANGPSTLKYEKEIKKLISENNLITIGCNYLKDIYKPLYHIFVSRKRFLKYVHTIDKESTLIIPTFFGKNLIIDNYTEKYEYIDIKSTENLNSKPIEGISHQSVYLNVAVAAILIAYQMGAKEIMVVGMDGYENENTKEVVYFYNENDVPDDKMVASLRYENLVAELKRVSNFLYENGILFSIITPTSHKRYYRNVIL